MAAGSLFDQLGNLEVGVSAILGLAGSAGGDGEEARGVAGAAAASENSPIGQLSGARDNLNGILGGVIQFESTASLEQAMAVAGQIRALTEGNPTEALDGFLGRLAAADGGMLGQLISLLRTVLQTVQDLNGEVPVNHTAIVGELLDQVLGVIGSMEGEEAEKIAAWARSVQDLAEGLLPVIEDVQANGGDAQDIVIAVFEHALARVLQVFGFGSITVIIDLSDGLAAKVLVDDQVVAARTAADPVDAALASLRNELTGEFPAFREGVVALRDAEQQFARLVGPVLSATRALLRFPLFQPGGLVAYLREKMQDALSVQVNEVQKVDEPFHALFDRIDAAIDGIDLSSVRDTVLGFFESLRSSIESVDLPNLPQLLDEGLAPVDEVVRDLEAGVATLMSQVEEFFDGLGGHMRELLEPIGSFDDQGRFTFDFIAELRAQLTRVRQAIGGNPADPEAPSVAGTLNDLQSQIDGFFAQLSSFLQPVVGQVEDAVDTATTAIGDFTTYLNGLDMPAKLELLRQKVAEILDELAPIDFQQVAEPVISALNENRDKLADIDAESLNDLLREALKVALDVIIGIDFTATISQPLDDGFQVVRDGVTDGLRILQRRYEQAIAVLDRLEPSQLLDFLVQAFDIIDNLLGQVDLATLLAPLDSWHTEYIREPVEDLRPSVLMAPLAAEFDSLLGNFDRISGESLMAPLQEGLDALKDQVLQLDLTSWIDDIGAAVQRVRDQLGAIRPSELLQPLVEDFALLESQLDQFSPSVLFQPVLQLAQPLLDMLEDVQEAAVEALHSMYQGPIEALDKLQPERLTQTLQGQIDQIIALIEGLRVPARINAFKAGFYDLRQDLETAGEPARIEFMIIADPAPRLDHVAAGAQEIVDGLRNLRDNLDLNDLRALYDELFEHFMAMIPPFARRLLEPDAFRHLMRQADPTRFLTQLDERFQALKNKLIPIRPQDIAAELDETYDTVLALVDGLDISGALDGIKDRINGFKDIVQQVRIDFLAEDIDAAIADAKAVAEGLSPAALFGELDGIHDEVLGVIDQTVPSTVLAGLAQPLEDVKDLIRAVDPRSEILPALDEAWQALVDQLAEVDFTVILSPIVDKLDGMYDDLIDTLGDVEGAFDGMLGAARGALSGSGASAGASV